jgi:hypothetical protein
MLKKKIKIRKMEFIYDSNNNNNNNNTNLENNDYNNNSLYDVNKIKKLGFIIELISFTKQSIRGAYLPIYRISSQKNIYSILKKNNAIKELLENYINNCWSSFNKKTDEYVIKKFETMKKYSNMSHDYCLFDFIWGITKTVNERLLIKINNDCLLNCDIFKEFLDKNLDNILSKEIDNINLFDFECNENCRNILFDESVLFTNTKNILS